MKYKFLFFFLIISSLVFSQNEKLDKTKTDNIQKVIRLFQAKNIDGISKIVNYPLSREYPIPNVKNGADLKKRFNQIFDEKIIDQISNSKLDQWSEVGWRGIMLDNGDLWIDTDGRITALNYQSQFETNQKNNIIANEKKNLFSSLKQYKSPVYKFTTKNYLIRIDELSNGKYRYASWKIGKKESTKPDLILANGEIRMEGSGGNHTITFKKDEFSYIIYRGIIGVKDAPEIDLTVEQKNKVILQQDGKLIQ
ncbi:MAG: hypothetical protein E2590_14705 [Chryseobacterium sp.]|nr:hypothetical protein [Chryseobacterium sp.]